MCRLPGRPAMTGNIFINYRREESSHVAGRLHTSLAPRFGRDKLFMDVDSIPVGRDFEEHLNSQVAACDAMLAIIGPNWLAAKDETARSHGRKSDDQWSPRTLALEERWIYMLPNSLLPHAQSPLGGMCVCAP